MVVMDCEKGAASSKKTSEVLQNFCDKGFCLSFPVLWNLCNTIIYRYIQGRLRGKDDAKDVYQEFGLKLYNFIPRHLLAMVPPVAFHVAKDEIANHFRLASLAADTLSLEDLLLHGEPETSDGNRPFEQWQRLQYHMNASGVSRDQQMAVILHHLLGFTVKEGAEFLDCKPETIKGRLRYAKQKLGGNNGGEMAS